MLEWESSQAEVHSLDAKEKKEKEKRRRGGQVCVFACDQVEEISLVSCFVRERKREEGKARLEGVCMCLVAAVECLRTFFLLLLCSFFDEQKNGQPLDFLGEEARGHTKR
jgi:hypothetical protein